MAENQESKNGKFNAFTPEGEAHTHISLDQARDNCDDVHCDSLADLLILENPTGGEQDARAHRR